MKRLIAGLMVLGIAGCFTGCVKESLSLHQIVNDALLDQIAQIIPTDDNGCIVIANEKREVRDENGKVTGIITNKKVVGKLNISAEKAGELYKQLNSGITTATHIHLGV